MYAAVAIGCSPIAISRWNSPRAAQWIAYGSHRSLSACASWARRQRNESVEPHVEMLGMAAVGAADDRRRHVGIKPQIGQPVHERIERPRDLQARQMLA